MESGEIGTYQVGVLLVTWLNEILFTIRKVKIKALLFIGQGFTQPGVLHSQSKRIYFSSFLLEARVVITSGQKIK